MQLKVGWTYKFLFNPEFSALDGVYSIVKIYTYNELLEENLNLYDGLYKHVDKTSEQLDEDVSTFRTDDIFKLVNPDDSEIVYYVPSLVLSNIPDPNIDQYSKLVIGVNLGVCKDEEELEYIKNTINDYIQKMHGLTNEPQVFSIGTVWLTDTEYADVVSQRDHVGKEVVNYFGENIRLRTELAKRDRIIEMLNQRIRSIASATP